MLLRLQSLSDLPFFNMLESVSGSAMQRFSIFSMGVSPYITASIIIQLMQMDIVPKFVEWSKQGEVGRQQIKSSNTLSDISLRICTINGIDCWV